MIKIAIPSITIPEIHIPETILTIKNLIMLVITTAIYSYLKYIYLFSFYSIISLLIKSYLNFLINLYSSSFK